MKAKLNLFLTFFFIVFCSAFINAQKFGLGVSAIYNFQTESFGFGIRGEIPKNRISLIPQIAYYPGFGKITEFYGGLSIHYDMFRIGKNWTVYALGHGAYNHWMNPKTDSQPSNWDAEAGLGIKTNKCLRPFMEYRYNFKWYETNLRIGVMYFWGCSNKKGKRKLPGKEQRKAVSCPNYK